MNLVIDDLEGPRRFTNEEVQAERVKPIVIDEELLEEIWYRLGSCYGDWSVSSEMVNAEINRRLRDSLDDSTSVL